MHSILPCQAVPPPVSARIEAFAPYPALSRRIFPVWVQPHEPALDDHETGCSERAGQQRAVFGKTLLPRLAMMKQVLHRVAWMLEARTHLRLRLLERMPDVHGRALAYPLDHAPPLRRMPVDVGADLHRLHRLDEFTALGCVGVARVGEHRLFLLVQQIVDMRHVALAGRRGVYALHHAQVGVRPDVRLHLEMPRISLLGLMHLGVTRLGLILRRRRRPDDRRSHRLALAQPRPALTQATVDLTNDRLAQLVPLLQPAELQQRRRIRRRFLRKVDTDEATHRLAVGTGLAGQLAPIDQRFLGGSDGQGS